MYGTKAWGMKERNKLDVMYMRCPRSISGVNRIDRLPNEEVREKLGVPNKLTDRVDWNALKWFGDVDCRAHQRGTYMTKRVCLSVMES